MSEPAGERFELALTDGYVEMGKGAFAVANVMMWDYVMRRLQ